MLRLWPIGDDEMVMAIICCFLVVAVVESFLTMPFLGLPWIVH
jgi:hypothetical protein